ncbi:hypothetical protein GOQ27_03325 [Clostridium sp. D2Q-11]|uniref:Uncharacterized protein n=1 Tax=Anaeromonas frigoriresistens TaxID=2683708 RepID=A0A942UV67_9FIRM|nr:hypothetical protein [Anaeromonas frigoriresistens]MBS4537476.1 hypothetical protein [Anaeromonas frigoriresistens]
MIKYKVVAVAYRDVEETIIKRICKNSIKDINSIDDLDSTDEFCTRGFNMNNRICIYLNWFRDEFKKKLEENYKIALMEMPFKEGVHRSEFLDLLDEEYGEEVLVLGKVDV